MAPSRAATARWAQKHAENLFQYPRDREAFLYALERGVGRDHALIVMRVEGEMNRFPKAPPMEWQPEWLWRMPDHFQPNRHPLHEEGAFYMVDYSSALAASLLLYAAERLSGRPIHVLDLCAAPGGKAIFASKAFEPEVLIANETQRPRVDTLIRNFVRCGIPNAAVWSMDPSVWGNKHRDSFDVVIVDAPCSGQSLLAKGMNAPGCWEPDTIEMNVGRQRRIMGHAVKCLRPGGFLLYSTCTFSRKENEKIVEWAVGLREGLEAVEVPALAFVRSNQSELPCYRVYPQMGYGAGAFMALLHLKGETTAGRTPLEFERARWRSGEPGPPPKGGQTISNKEA